jgi:hypothetical protein
MIQLCDAMNMLPYFYPHNGFFRISPSRKTSFEMSS